MGLLHRRFKFGDNHDIESIVIRRTNGHDERDAAKMLDAREGHGSIFNELVRIAIVAVNDQPVIQPFMDYDSWSTKTRELLMTAYNSMNENSEAEKAAFLAASEDVAPLVQRAEPRQSGGHIDTTTK